MSVAKAYQESLGKLVPCVRPIEDFNLGYCTLGVNGEVGEVVESIDKYFELREPASDEVFEMNREEALKDSVIVECGDLMWYVTASCNAIMLDLETIWPEESVDLHWEDEMYTMQTTLRSAADRVAELVKKYYRDGREVAFHLKMEYIVILTCLAGILNLVGSTLDECAEINYEKTLNSDLRKRDL